MSNKYITVLDVQNEYVLCALIKHFSGSYQMENIFSKAIPSPENPDETAHIIKSMFQEVNAYPSGRLITSISGRDVAIRILSLPPLGGVKAKELDEMVKYELMIHLPVNVEGQPGQL